MKHPDWILAHARLCLHSTLCCGKEAGDKLDPDYVCDRTRFYHDGKGPVCTLLTAQECPHRELFPEDRDQ